MLDNVMHLFLFEWLMIMGLQSFLNADDLIWLQELAGKVRGKLRSVSSGR
jgi:hypothetical protein